MGGTPPGSPRSIDGRAMLWETAFVEIRFETEVDRDTWLGTEIDLASETLIAEWDWHALFHAEISDGWLWEEVPERATASALIARCGDLAEPSWDDGALSFATASAAEAAVVEPLLACVLAVTAAAAGGSARILLFGGHDPDHLFGYADDYCHYAIHLPGKTEVEIDPSVAEEVYSLAIGELDRAFEMALAHPADDGD